MKLKKIAALLLSAALVFPVLAPPNSVQAEEVVEYTSLPIENPGFEESGTEATGWTIQIANPTQDPQLVTEAVVSQVRAFQGNNSLKMTDFSTPKGLSVFSSSIPVVGGETYRLTSHVYVTAKSVQNYIKFYNAAGVEVGTKNLVANTLNQWATTQFEHTAPATAVTAKILFYMSTTTIGTNVFIDNVEFHHKKVSIINPLEVPYGEPVMIGDAVKIALSQSAAYGVGPGGRAEQYLTTVGSPAAFHAVDAATGELLFTQNLPYSDTIWAMTMAPDGNLYFATTVTGDLYRYVIQERRLENLGVNPSNKMVYDLKASADGKLYGATYSNTGTFGRVFEYDIASATFRDLGVMKEGQQYVRGLGITDDYLYAGIGTTAALMKYNLRTGEITEIQIPGISGNSGTLSEIIIAGGKLLVNASTKLHILDEATGEFLKTIEYQSKVSPPSPFEPNKIYYKLKGDLFKLDLETLESVKVEGIPMLPDDTAIKSHEWIVPSSGKFAGRTVLAGMAAFGDSFLYDPIANEYELHQADVPAYPATVNSLEARGGYVYIGGYQRGMSIYDTRSGEFIYNNKAFHQSEGIGFYGDIVYFGTYSGAKMYRLDMTKPLEYSELQWANPGLAADIGEDQDRPFSITSGDGKLFIGTFPTYGALGGGLTILEEHAAPDGTVTSVTYETYRNVVPNQSVMGLAYKDGKVFGSTSPLGGLGITPTETAAKIFAYDVNSKQVTVAPFTPNFSSIPGGTGPINQIGELSIGPDGLLWGIADRTVYKPDGIAIDHYDGILFAMDPSTSELKIVKSKLVTPSPFNTSKYRPYYLRWGSDGLLYTTIGRKIFAVDPADLRTKTIMDTTVNLMAMDDDGSIYYVNGSKLYKIPVNIDRAALTFDAGKIYPGETIHPQPQVLLANGKTASMGRAAITYTSSDSSVVSATYGTLKAVAPGTAAIQASITLDGRTVTTPATTVTVDRPNATLAGPVSVPEGGNLALTYGFSNVYTSVYAKSVTVNYDPALLAFDSVQELVGGLKVIGKSDKPGQLRLLEAATSGAVSGTKDLLTLNFRALSTDQSVTASVYLSDVVIADDLGNETSLDPGAPYQVSITAVDKMELNGKIAEAQALWAKATHQIVDDQKALLWGHYRASSVQALKAAIDAAIAVADNTQVEQAAIDQAANTLVSAVQAFIGSAGQTASIGDLGVMAVNYAATPESVNWVSIEMYDIDTDGTIDIWDLSELARIILN